MPTRDKLRFNLIHYFTIFFLILLSAYASAQTRWYRVEIIIFQQPLANLNLEYWPLLPPISNIKDCISRLETSPPENDPSFYRFDTLDTLQNIANILHHNKTPILLQLAWIQGFNDNKPHKIHLYGSASDQLNQEKTPYENSSTWTLNGSVAIALKHYLELQFNLAQTLDLSVLKPIINPQHQYLLSSPENSFYFSSFQKTRSHVLNYIDSPLLGIIYKITKSSQPVDNDQSNIALDRNENKSYQPN